MPLENISRRLFIRSGSLYNAAYVWFGVEFWEFAPQYSAYFSKIPCGQCFTSGDLVKGLDLHAQLYINFPSVPHRNRSSCNDVRTSYVLRCQIKMWCVVHVGIFGAVLRALSGVILRKSSRLNCVVIRYACIYLRYVLNTNFLTLYVLVVARLVSPCNRFQLFIL